MSRQSWAEWMQGAAAKPAARRRKPATKKDGTRVNPKPTRARNKLGVMVPIIAEGEVQKAAVGYLEHHRLVAFAHRQNTGGAYYPKKGGGRQFVRFGYPGMADIVGLMTDGRMLQVECKRPGKKPSDDQQKNIDAINEAGGLACWIDDLSQLVDFMNEHGG